MRSTYVHLLFVFGATLTTYVNGHEFFPRYNLSPKSRTIRPASIHSQTGTIPSNKTSDGSITVFTLRGPGASVTWDFDQMIAGVPTLHFGNFVCGDPVCNSTGLPGFQCGSGCQGVGVSYTESSNFVGYTSDNSTLYSHSDGALYVPITDGPYEIPSRWGRGSFRYLTVSLPESAASTTQVEIQVLGVHFTADPLQHDLQAYSGYFSSSDTLLNRIWHAGVYTLQLCTVRANNSVQHTWLLDPSGWSQDASASGISLNETFLGDGAKRDRSPWAGDLGVSMKSLLVSKNTDNLRSIRNSLEAMITLQDPQSGYFPYVGSPLGNLLIQFGAEAGIQPYNSDTYHLWTIIGIAEYVILSGDLDFANLYWPNVTRALDSVRPYIDNTTSLFNGTKTDDWGRVGMGGMNIALNSLYYHALQVVGRLSRSLNHDNETRIRDWESAAEHVKSSANELLFDPIVGLYFDNTTSAGRHLYPQDGNVAAIIFNLTLSGHQARTITTNLSARLSSYGSSAPELPGSISPFIGSLELIAQFTANPHNSSSALALLRTQWGYMLEAFSNSTLIEGYGADGSLNYGFYPGGSSFISHAHAWSTGPAYSLISYVAGLRSSALDPSSEDGSWLFHPAVHGSNLTFAKGGFETKDGVFDASWKLNGCSLTATISTPNAMVGTIYVPAGSAQVVKIDSKRVTNGVYMNGFLRFANISGGVHTIEVF